MKVVAFNGSPHKKGNTYQSLLIVCDTLEKYGIDTEIIQVGGRLLQRSRRVRGIADPFSSRGLPLRRKTLQAVKRLALTCNFPAIPV